jgi:hypothetical protein
MTALLKKAFLMAVKPASAVSHTISNSTLASLSVATVARHPALARVVTSASPVSRLSVTSLTLPRAVHEPPPA